MKTLEHKAFQKELEYLLHRLGYGAVLPEHHWCDLMAVSPRSAAILGVEIEREGNGHVLKNLSRNFDQGCANVLIVCPDVESLGQVARKLSRTLPPQFRERTGLASMSALRLIQPIRFPSVNAWEIKP